MPSVFQEYERTIGKLKAENGESGCRECGGGEQSGELL